MTFKANLEFSKNFYSKKVRANYSNEIIITNIFENFDKKIDDDEKRKQTLQLCRCL